MALNLIEARKMVLDLGHPKKWLYSADFLLSYSIAIVGFVLAYPHPLSSFAFWGWGLVCVLAFYRALSFIHEISHFRQRLGGFHILWNALAGMPMAFPSFMYTRSHAIHHNPNTYGTSNDGEYIAFHKTSRWQMVLYLASSFWTPPLLILRFAILYPISLFVAPLRRFLIERGSSVVITFDYIGEPPKGREIREWRVMETACCVFWLIVLALCMQGMIPWRVLGVGYLVMSSALVFNGMRTLAAHRFANDGAILTIESQLLDSVNLSNRFPAWIFSALAAPVGLRFHALHHLFPFLPYHSLGEAHRRLSTRLPADSSYHQASEPGVFSAVFKLWGRAPSPKLQAAATPAPLST